MSTRDLFRSTLDDFAAKAKVTLPDSTGRIDSAVKLVLSNDVELHADGSATVGSRTNPAKVYSGVNGTCPCVDFPRAPQGFCAHRIARALQIRTDRAMRTLLDAEVSSGVLEGCTDDEEPTPGENAGMETSTTLDATLGLGEGKNGGPAAESLPDLLKPFTVTIQGKPFVKVAGLLQLAHARGLQSLTTIFTYNDAELALAQSTAVFPFGSFTDVGDASPSSVNPKVRLHFRRVAATRSTARALRQALNIPYVALEELGEDA